MKLCAYCRNPVFLSKTRDYCSNKCATAASRARAEEELDKMRPTRKTTPQDIEIALARARAGMS